MISFWLVVVLIIVQAAIVGGSMYMGYHMGYVARHKEPPPPVFDFEGIVEAVHERMKPKSEEEETKKEEGFY
jgi:hypothetical protein